MRAAYPAFFVGVALAFADEPTTRQPLTTVDAAALEEATALGQRVLTALARYLAVSRPPNISGGSDLLARTPTIEVLHAIGYLSDSDIALSNQYHATLYPVPPEPAATQPVLTMHTDRGELIFDAGGNVALELHK